MTREELLRSEEYWLCDIQTGLWKIFNSSKDRKKQSAYTLDITKYQYNDLLNGDIDISMSKLVHIAMKLGYVPIINFKLLEEVISEDSI